MAHLLYGPDLYVCSTYTYQWQRCCILDQNLNEPASLGQQTLSSIHPAGEVPEQRKGIRYPPPTTPDPPPTTPDPPTTPHRLPPTTPTTPVTTPNYPDYPRRLPPTPRDYPPRSQPVLLTVGPLNTG